LLRPRGVVLRPAGGGVLRHAVGVLLRRPRRRDDHPLRPLRPPAGQHHLLPARLRPVGGGQHAREGRRPRSRTAAFLSWTAFAPCSAPHVRRASLAAADRFLGLAWSDGGVVEGDNFAARVPDVWAGLNHNWLRLTRVLRSLKLLGLESEAEALHDWLEVLARS